MPQRVAATHEKKHKTDVTLTSSMTLKFNRLLQVVEVRAKFHRAGCSGSWVIVYTNFIALSRDGKKSENPVLWT